jgi:hypothetical protein
MEHCKIYRNRTEYEELKTFKIVGKCIKDCHIISDSVNGYFISQDIQVNGRKLNIEKSDINHPMEYLYQTLKKKTFSWY